ncbi:MAG TPA: secretin N-terminal domain-containing protein, partial [Dissulfurispiraceae bacterium]
MHKRVTAFILIAAVLFLAAAEAPLRAQQPPPSPAGPSPAQAAPPAPHQPPSRAAQATERLGEVSFNFDDADIFDVIQTVFGEILKVNYLIDPRVRGRVNFRTVTPVPRSDVLPIMEVLLRLNGAGYLERNGIYEILPLNEIPGTTPKIFVYPLQNSKAAHISTLLQSIFSGATPPPAFRPPSPGAPPGTQPPAPRTGASVIATGTGVLVAPETRVLADEITNSLIILATPNDFNFIEDTIKKLDTVPRQVVIEALIAEVTLTDQLQFGLEWLISNNVSFRTDPMKRSTSLNGVIGQNTADLAAVDLTKGVQGFSYAAVDAAGKVKALLQALASESKLNILAS